MADYYVLNIGSKMRRTRPLPRCRSAKLKSMATLMLDMPESLLKRVEPFSRWLPSILELSLIEFSTPAAVAAHEVMAFLAGNPSVNEVSSYRASAQRQARTDKLLALNRAGVISETEQQELDELLKLEHALVMLKTNTNAV